MAVQRPGAGIVRRELDDHVSIRRQELDVSALRVRRVHDRRAVPGSGAGGEDEHVVAVEVDGVGGRDGVVQDDTDAGVAAVVVDVPLRVRGVGVVADVAEKEDGVIVVCAEGGVVHGPDPVSCAVLAEPNLDRVGCGGVWIGSDGVVGYCEGEVVANTYVCNGI